LSGLRLPFALRGLDLLVLDQTFIRLTDCQEWIYILHNPSMTIIQSQKGEKCLHFQSLSEVRSPG